MKYGNKLPENHELYWIEESIEKILGLTTPTHENEHSAMMRYFGIRYRNHMPLNGTYDQNSKEWILDREYHLKLHLKFWNEVNNHVDLVARYKAQFGRFAFDDVKIPSIEGIE